MNFSIPTPKTEAVELDFKGSQSTRDPMSAGEAYTKAIKLCYKLEKELFTAKEALTCISLCAKNSMSTKEEIGSIARVFLED